MEALLGTYVFFYSCYHLVKSFLFTHFLLFSNVKSVYVLQKRTSLLSTLCYCYMENNRGLLPNNSKLVALGF